jgi:hypothetical protein
VLGHVSTSLTTPGGTSAIAWKHAPAPHPRRSRTPSRTPLLLSQKASVRTCLPLTVCSLVPSPSSSGQTRPGGTTAMPLIRSLTRRRGTAAIGVTRQRRRTNVYALPALYLVFAAGWWTPTVVKAAGRCIGTAAILHAAMRALLPATSASPTDARTSASTAGCSTGSRARFPTLAFTRGALAALVLSAVSDRPLELRRALEFNGGAASGCWNSGRSPSPLGGNRCAAPTREPAPDRR